jgi:hypothetical protein
LRTPAPYRRPTPRRPGGASSGRRGATIVTCVRAWTCRSFAARGQEAGARWACPDGTGLRRRGRASDGDRRGPPAGAAEHPYHPHRREHQRALSHVDDRGLVPRRRHALRSGLHHNPSLLPGRARRSSVAGTSRITETPRTTIHSHSTSLRRSRGISRTPATQPRSTASSSPNGGTRRTFPASTASRSRRAQIMAPTFAPTTRATRTRLPTRRHLTQKALEGFA